MTPRVFLSNLISMPALIGTAFPGATALKAPSGPAASQATSSRFFNPRTPGWFLFSTTLADTAV